MTKIETERLYLREMTQEDFDRLYAVLADSDIMQHYPYTFDEARVRNWINKNLERYRVFGFGLWAVCLKENGLMIGDCGLTMQNVGSTILPEIGYHIAKDYQRRGYAKEAARAVRDWTFRNTPFLAVYSYMQKENIPSSATARANGMRFVDTFPDEGGREITVYGITRDEWLKLEKEKEKRTMENRSFIIERARPEDAAALLEYLKIVGGETKNLSFGAEGIPLGLEAEQDRLGSQVGSTDSVMFLAKAEGEIIGTASLNRLHKRMRHRGEFGISVKKAWWGCGVAPALMEAILAFARENGFEQLNLEVRSDNARAIRLYEKFGFRKLCVFPAFFKIDGENIDFDLMNLELNP